MASSSHRGHGRPPRLPEVFPAVSPPVFFVTLCTRNRRPLLANDRVHERLRTYGDTGAARGLAAMGRYVILPDHIHAFVRCSPDVRLGNWVKGLKVAIAQVLPSEPETRSGHWQTGFFDHLLRHNENYAEKWMYVRDNPVRAGLTQTSEDWPYQGEIVSIDRV